MDWQPKNPEELVNEIMVGVLLAIIFGLGFMCGRFFPYQ